jgi:hypothetical protein
MGTQRKICVCRVLSVDSPLNRGWEKGAFQKRPFFQGQFSWEKGAFQKRPFFQGSIFFVSVEKVLKNCPFH